MLYHFRFHFLFSLLLHFSRPKARKSLKMRREKIGKKWKIAHFSPVSLCVCMSGHKTPTDQYNIYLYFRPSGHKSVGHSNDLRVAGL